MKVAVAGSKTSGVAGRGAAVDGAKRNSMQAMPAGTRARRSVGSPDAPRCAASRLRRPVKWVINHCGRKEAKLASRSTANIAVASREVAIVVYGSVRMGRLRTLDFGAEPGAWDGESGRRKK